MNTNFKFKVGDKIKATSKDIQARGLILDLKEDPNGYRSYQIFWFAPILPLVPQEEWFSATLIEGFYE